MDCTTISELLDVDTAVVFEDTAEDTAFSDLLDVVFEDTAVVSVDTAASFFASYADSRDDL